jgi:hypothetical protein
MNGPRSGGRPAGKGGRPAGNGGLPAGKWGTPHLPAGKNYIKPLNYEKPIKKCIKSCAPPAVLGWVPPPPWSRRGGAHDFI